MVACSATVVCVYSRGKVNSRKEPKIKEEEEVPDPFSTTDSAHFFAPLLLLFPVTWRFKVGERLRADAAVGSQSDGFFFLFFSTRETAA